MDDLNLQLQILEMLKEEREENKRLTNIILQHLGLSTTIGDVTIHVEGNNADRIPIGRNSNWPARRMELERKYRKAAEAASEELIDLPEIRNA